jgi:hypothetical protein
MERVTMPDRASTEEQFCYYTEKAGDIARQLGFAGLALIWLFHVAASGQDAGIAVKLSTGFKCPIQLIVASLAIDALQYLAGSALWGVAYITKPTGQAFENRGWNISAIVFPSVLIVVKLVLMIAAYWFLLHHLYVSTLWS